MQYNTERCPCEATWAFIVATASPRSVPAAAAAAAAVPGRPPTMAVPAPVEGRAATLVETCAGKAGVPRVADAVAMVEVGGQAGGRGVWWVRERRVVLLERTHLQLVLPLFRLGTRGALFRLFGRDDSGLRLGIRPACLRLEVHPGNHGPHRLRHHRCRYLARLARRRRSGRRGGGRNCSVAERHRVGVVRLLGHQRGVERLKQEDEEEEEEQEERGTNTTLSNRPNSKQRGVIEAAMTTL